MRRTIDAHLRAMRFAPPLSPFSSSSSSSPPLASVRRTIFSYYHFQALSPKPYALSLSKTLVPCTNSATDSSLLGLRNQSFCSGSVSGFGLLIVRCVSSVSPARTFEWNEPVPCSEVGDSCSQVGDGCNGTVEEDAKPSIPVRAFFFSTRFVFNLGFYLFIYLLMGYWWRNFFFIVFVLLLLLFVLRNSVNSGKFIYECFKLLGVFFNTLASCFFSTFFRV